MDALQIIHKYAAQEVKFQHKVLMIWVNNSIVKEKSIYDAVRFAWRIDKSRAEKAELVLAVEKGIIIGVFIAQEWKRATIKNFPEFNDDEPKRWAFVGREADTAIANSYLNKRIPSEYRKKGASNPIKYNY